MVALPDNAPVNVVAETDVKPVSVRLVAPSAILVEPIVNELVVRAPLGMLVSAAPEPTKPVADNIPVLGTKDNFVVDTFSG